MELRRPLLLSFALAAFQYGCNGAASAGPNSAANVSKRDTVMVHEPCDVNSSDAEKLDANGDGRAEIVIVKSGGREVCRAVDLNFDGKIDVWEYRDASGQVRRRETDYDRDGKIDEVAEYRNGVLVSKVRATTLNDKVDTWQYYDNGVLARVERDSDGDGVVDQWWEYKRPDCPLIHADTDGDGRPDPGATVDYCKETGYTPPVRAEDVAASGQKRFERSERLPTETDQKSDTNSDSTKGTGQDKSTPQPSGGKK